MEKLYSSKTFLKMAGGRMHAPHPIPLNPPLVISHRNQCGIFQSLDSINFVLFTKKQSQKGKGGMEQCPPAPLIRSCGEEQKRFTRPQMFYKKVKGSRLDSRKEFIFLQVPTGRIKMVSRAVCCPCPCLL